MNKDTKKEMALEARIQLQISDSQTNKEMSKFQPQYFFPEEFKSMDPALTVML